MTSSQLESQLDGINKTAQDGLTVHCEDSEKMGLDQFNFSEEEERKLIRRIDLRLIPIVGLMYCVSLIDRTNIAAASIAGMMEDLQLIGNRYSIITLVFFTTYIIFQPPSTVVCRKLGPRVFLAGITLLWGVVMIGMGFTKKWEQLAALRVILGLLEAGFFPSCIYLLSTWYNRYEMGKRYGLFYAFGAVTGAFAGLMAYGLVHMHGIANMSGWRWLFIIEGVLTCVVALVGYFLLIDFPDTDRNNSKFLSAHERAWVVARVNADRGDAKPTQFNLKKFLFHMLDIKVWGFGLLFFCCSTQGYAMSFFTPIILTAGMGFDRTATQLINITPMLAAAVSMYATGWIGDRYKIRGPLIIINSMFAIVGMTLMGFHKTVGVRFFGIFLTAAGVNGNLPTIMTYQANNIRGQWKRASCSAILVGLGGVGGIAGSLVFRPADAPYFRPGLWACISCSLASIVIVLLLSARFYMLNRSAERDGVVLEDEPDSEVSEEDRSSFRYTY